MKHFLYRLFGCLGGFSIVLVFAWAVLPSPDANSFMAAFADKQAALKNAPTGSVVIVGGSNCAFGIDSERLAACLSRPVLNNGLHAGSGMDFILETSCPLLKKGDIAVFAFEYAHFLGGASGESSTAFQCLAFAPQYASSLSVRTLLRSVVWNFILDLPRTDWRQFRSWLSKHSGRPEVQAAVYARNRFNMFGDVIGHLDHVKPVHMIPHMNLDSRHIDFSAVERFGRQLKALRGRGVRVVVMPPVYQKSSFMRSEGRIRQIGVALARAGVPFDAPPERYALDDNLFYDTVYHLNARGRRERTRLLAEDLLAVKGLKQVKAAQGAASR